jgi:hypothetical protein
MVAAEAEIDGHSRQQRRAVRREHAHAVHRVVWRPAAGGPDVARRIETYDFWNDTEMWVPIAYADNPRLRSLAENRCCFPDKASRTASGYCPRIPALRLSAPSVRFIVLAIFATGVRALECALSSLTSSFDHGLRCTVVFFIGTYNLSNALF